jgi:hypothetical protein
MLTRMVLAAMLGPCVWLSASFTQQIPTAKPASSSAAAAVAQEFPVVMQQNVVAGKTPVGTKVQAKLTAATLVNGKVIPRNAVLSGKVLVSTGKTSSEPSRLAIRMDSAQWKNETAPLTIYVTSWYYQAIAQSGQDLQYGPQMPANRTWNGEGQYPDPNSKIYRPFPAGDTDKSSSVPDTPTSVTSNHRVQMKNIESEHAPDGCITLVSKHGNIKLDKLTTYVLASRDPVPASTK